MDLRKLFDMQRVLKDHIGYEGEDRFNKLILALLVELGECANEWRGFKFWSNDQESRTSKHVLKKEYKHLHITQTGAYEYQLRDEFGKIIFDDVTDFHHDHKNPLLEEYADGLHFVLELGIELEIVISEYVQDCFVGIERQIPLQIMDNITKQFTLVSKLTAMLEDDDYYCELFAAYLNLGKMLGFTWEEIEQAYISKNEINHQRQETGY